MLAWMSENLATILVLGVLIAIVGLIVANMIRSKKNGKSPCGCDCGGCNLCGGCHSGKK